jgi:hypothetical protein
MARICNECERLSQESTRELNDHKDRGERKSGSQQ